jgi:hypothetical protein
MKLLLITLWAMIMSTLSIRFEKVAQETNKKVPIINVYSESPDRDPLDVKRDYDEKNFEKERIANIELMENEDKYKFRELLHDQNDLQHRLDMIAEDSTEILNNMLKHH